MTKDPGERSAATGALALRCDSSVPLVSFLLLSSLLPSPPVPSAPLPSTSVSSQYSLRLYLPPFYPPPPHPPPPSLYSAPLPFPPLIASPVLLHIPPPHLRNHSGRVERGWKAEHVKRDADVTAWKEQVDERGDHSCSVDRKGC